MSELEIIEKLAQCIRNKTFSLHILPDKNLSKYSLKEIRIDYEGCNLVITIFDEYSDTEIPNSVLWLNLIVDTCKTYEQAEDYKTWLSDEGYPDNDFFKSLYQKYADIVPKVRKITGDKLESIPYHHIEFNTDIVKKLREYKL